MEDSGKHRFHGLEHDSKMRLFETYSHTSTLRGYKSLGENATAEKHKRRTETGKRGTEHSSEWRDRQARELSLPQISEGNGARENGKRVLCRTIETKTKCESAGVEGERVKDLASKTPNGRKTHSDALPTKPNSRARNGHRASPCGGVVETGWIFTRKIPRRRKVKNRETGSNTRGQ